MARNISKTDAENAAANIIIGIIFILIGVAIQSQRFRAYAVIGGIVVLLRGLLQAGNGISLSRNSFSLENIKSTALLISILSIFLGGGVWIITIIGILIYDYLILSFSKIDMG